MVATIEGIKKVRLDLFLENPHAGKENPPVPFEMIFGIGTAGYCAFELSLAGKKVGDIQRIQVLASQADEFFGQFYSEIRFRLGLQIIPAEMIFLFEVKDIIDADNREVVKALAQGGGHSCGGSCDCGCS